MQNVLCLRDVNKFGLRGYKDYVDYNWHGRMISIRYMLSRTEFYQMIHRITDMCSVDDGVFTGEYLDFAIKLYVVAAYAAIELPDNLDDAYTLLYYSDIYDVVLNNACKRQLDSINKYFYAGD